MIICPTSKNTEDTHEEDSNNRFNCFLKVYFHYLLVGNSVRLAFLELIETRSLAILTCIIKGI